MKKKINTGFMLIAAIAIVVTAVCSMFLFYQILEEQIFDDLKNMTAWKMYLPWKIIKNVRRSQKQ